MSEVYARTALFSPCRRYRYTLWRHWGGHRGYAMFVGLNPSTADEERDDPTVRRCIGYARDWGYGGLEVMNLFARISPSPALLRRCPDPVGRHCDAWLRRRLRRLAAMEPPAQLWLGWGNAGSWRDRDAAVLALVAAEGWSVHCLGRTRLGQPLHPLYQPRGGSLEPFAAF